MLRPQVFSRVPVPRLSHNDSKWSTSSFDWSYIRSSEVIHLLSISQFHEIDAPKQSAGVILSCLDDDFDASISSSSIITSSSSPLVITIDSSLHYFTCICNDIGSLKAFSHWHLNVSSIPFLTSVNLPFLNLTLTDYWCSRLTWFFSADFFRNKSPHVLHDKRVLCIFSNDECENEIVIIIFYASLLRI